MSCKLMRSREHSRDIKIKMPSDFFLGRCSIFARPLRSPSRPGLGSCATQEKFSIPGTSFAKFAKVDKKKMDALEAMLSDDVPRLPRCTRV